jgi:hypothetical protein
MYNLYFDVYNTSFVFVIQAMLLPEPCQQHVKNGYIELNFVFLFDTCWSSSCWLSFRFQALNVLQQCITCFCGDVKGHWISTGKLTCRTSAADSFHNWRLLKLNAVLASPCHWLHVRNKTLCIKRGRKMCAAGKVLRSERLDSVKSCFISAGFDLTYGDHYAFTIGWDYAENLQSFACQLMVHIFPCAESI